MKTSLWDHFLYLKAFLENEDAFRETFKSKIIMYLFEDAAKQRRHMLFGGCDEDIRNQYSTIMRGNLIKEA